MKDATNKELLREIRIFVDQRNGVRTIDVAKAFGITRRIAEDLLGKLQATRKVSCITADKARAGHWYTNTLNVCWLSRPSEERACYYGRLA